MIRKLLLAAGAAAVLGATALKPTAASAFGSITTATSDGAGPFTLPLWPGPIATLLSARSSAAMAALASATRSHARP